MGRLVVLLTTPRLPAGLLTGAAWIALREADLVCCSSLETPQASALIAQGVRVEAKPGAGAAQLQSLASGHQVVWLADDADDPPLQTLIARDVVARSQQHPGAGDEPAEVEIMLGSFDPPGARLLDLVEVMDTLRRECPWDQQQTHESLVRYLVEESYETIEAIESGDRDHLREELGDLLLQVMFHARVASQHPDEPFDIDDVAATIVDKLIRRHPHVFAGLEVAGVDDVEANWETIKATENSRTSAMEGIPPGLPALSLAAKVVSRSAAVGLTSSVPRPAETAYTEETLGDVLFALVAAAHAAGIDAEQALRSRARREMADVRAREDRVDRVAEVATE